jgi:hypothetical protein
LIKVFTIIPIITIGSIFIVKRIVLSLFLFLGFGLFSVSKTAAQAVMPGPAQQPTSAQPAGNAPKLSPPPPVSNSAQRQKPVGAPLNQPAVSYVQMIKGPEQAKIVKIFRGEGYFDSSLADRLKPILAKSFGAPKKEGVSPATVLNPLLGQLGIAPKPGTASSP